MNEDDKETSMWAVLKNLLSVITCYETNPSNGYLYDEKLEKYASEPVRDYINKARERLERRNSLDDVPLVQLGEVQRSVTLIAHPLQNREYWRNAVVQIYHYV